MRATPTDQLGKPLVRLVGPFPLLDPTRKGEALAAEPGIMEHCREEASHRGLAGARIPQEAVVPRVTLRFNQVVESLGAGKNKTLTGQATQTDTWPVRFFAPGLVMLRFPVPLSKRDNCLP